MNSERQNNSANLTKRKTVQDLLYELKNPRKPQMKKCKSLRPELDVESIRSKMKQKWRGNIYII